MPMKPLSGMKQVGGTDEQAITVAHFTQSTAALAVLLHRLSPWFEVS